MIGLIAVPLFSGSVFAESKAKQEAKRREELKNTEWGVLLYSADPKKKSEENGTLVFQNSTLNFKGFKGLNIGEIGYTLTAHEDNEKGTWETYVITKDGNISVRGDWEGKVMNGIVSEQSDGGKRVKVLRFTSVNQVRTIEPPVEKSKEAQAKTPAENPPKALVSK